MDSGYFLSSVMTEFNYSLEGRAYYEVGCSHIFFIFFSSVFVLAEKKILFLIPRYPSFSDIPDFDFVVISSSFYLRNIKYTDTFSQSKLESIIT